MKARKYKLSKTFVSHAYAPKGNLSSIFHIWANLKPKKSLKMLKEASKNSTNFNTPDWSYSLSDFSCPSIIKQFIRPKVINFFLASKDTTSMME